MKIVILSDNHCDYNFDTPKGDVLIHAGDFSFTGKPTEILSFVEWFEAQPHEHKLWIPGNHELSLEDYPYNIEIIEQKTNSICMHNREHMIDDVSFFGTAYTPRFNHWSFGLSRERSEIFWEGASEADVVICHGPPKDILDSPTPEYPFDRFGCEYFAKYIERTKPKLVCFGHIHGSGGQTVEKDGTIYANVALMSEDYEIVNEPTVIELNGRDQ